MKQILVAGCLAMCLLVATTGAYSQETSLVVTKDREGLYTAASKANIAKFEGQIANEGSIVVWVTLDPGIVGFSPGLSKSMSEDEEDAQDARTARELARVLRPAMARKQAAFAREESKSQFGTSGLIRINNAWALHHILSDRSVVMVSSVSL